MAVLRGGETLICELSRDPTRAWLSAVVEAAHDDPWWRRVRHAIQREHELEGQKELVKLAEEADIERQSIVALTRLASSLKALDKKINLLRRVWQRHPADAKVNFELAVALDGAEPPQREEAVRYMTGAVTLRPHSEFVRSKLGWFLIKLGRLEEGIAQFREAIHIGPKVWQIRTALGNALELAGKHEAAIVEYREALRLNPEADSAHNCLGDFLMRQGKHDEAIAEFREAMRLDPYRGVYHTNLGLALKNQGKLDEAIAEYREAIRLDPDHGLAHNNLGIVLGRQGKFDEAIAKLREAIRLNPDHSGFHNNFGVALKRQGKHDEAIAEYREAIRLDPDDGNFHSNLGFALARQGKYNEAIDECREAIRLNPDNGRFRNDLGATLASQGKLSEAIFEYREAIRLAPNYAGAHNNLAWLLVTADPEWRLHGEATKLALKATELAPQDTSFWNTLGVARYRDGQWREAVTALEKSDELARIRPAVESQVTDWLFLAMAHWQLGEKDKAREWHQKATAWMKDNKPEEQLKRFRMEADELLDREPAETEHGHNSEPDVPQNKADSPEAVDCDGVRSSQALPGR